MGDYVSTPITTKEFEESENSILKFAACGMQGWRKGMEDSHIADIKVDNECTIFGVFDGHGGAEVALFVKKHFVDILKSSDSYKSKNYGKALSEAFLYIDRKLDTLDSSKELNEISKQCNQASSFNSLIRKEGENIAIYVGCTACVALITKSKIYVANSGDSRCVLCRNGKAIDMSEDHKPDNPKEKDRIIKAKGFVEDNRVNGVLNLSRSIGDLEYKKNKDLSQEEQIITVLPDLKEETITPDTEFLIIGCDGIWDCLTSQKACDFIKDKTTRQSPSKSGNKLSKILESMFESILAKDVTSSMGIGCDNMTCIIIFFK